MRRNHKNKLRLSILLCVLLIGPLFINIKAYAYIDTYEPNIKKMNSWISPSPESFYTIESFALSDYLHYNNWKVEVDGAIKGEMTLMRPVSDSSAGRTFAHPSQLKEWGKIFNGNPDYVEERLNSILTRIVHNVTGEPIYRAYSRDIASASGALLSIRGTGESDSYGNQYGIVEVKTTPFPKASISAPKSVSAGKEFIVKISGEEFEPSSTDMISYNVSADSTSLHSGVKYVNKISDKEIAVVIDSPGTRTLNLVITDKVQRSTKVSTVINVVDPDSPPVDPEPPPAKDNEPPVASLYTEPKIYWVEQAEFLDNSYDTDGEIVFSEISVDGEVSGASKKFSRVTEPEEHTASIYVVDNVGASDEDEKSFTVLPTTPTAEVQIEGTLKENRRVLLDATYSDKKSPIDVAPIDYSKTKWSIEPVTPGINPSGIKIRTSGDKSKRELLLREAGTYKLSTTVTNVFGEESKPFEKEFKIVKDEKPINQFTVSTAKAIRDKNQSKIASIELKDTSYSPDEDIIKQRIYYVEYDTNNDGFFGTPEDGGRKVISNGNKQEITYQTDKVGNYRFSMEIVEDFGQPTLKEFIDDSHYRRDISEMLDSSGKVSTYQNPLNFNLRDKDKSVEVINVAPIIDFGVRRNNKIDLILNFGGMDVATLEHKTGSSGLSDGAYYDHYYYSLDETDKNTLSSLASTMEANLLQKGIDANVIIDNSYYHQEDTDGEGIRNIADWGYVDRGSYSYSSYSGTSPYSGSWEVISSSSEPIIGVTWCYLDNRPSGGQLHSHPPPCTDNSNAEYGEVGTQYYADLRKWYSNYQYEIVGRHNSGINSTEKIDTTDFTKSFVDQTYRPDAQRIYMRMDNTPWSWSSDATKVFTMIDKAKQENVYFWNKAAILNKFNAETLISGNNGLGKYDIYDTAYLYANVKDVENYITNKYMIEENPESMTIVLGDEVDYTTKYSDHEDDPELKREWKFNHDPTQINGRVIDNQPAGPIPQNNLYINSPLQFTEVGTYKVQLRAKDNPVYDSDIRFNNYQKWSDEEVQREYTINVHRRPIADFTYTVDPTTLGLTLDPAPSYDPDHETNRADKGIIEYTWVSYTVDGNEVSGPPPSTLEVNKDYDVTLRVKDIDGAYGVVTKRISTQGFNIKPVAKFDVSNLVLTDQPLNIVDRSYDPNGDPLTDYEITVRESGNSTILRTLSSFPSNFDEMGLGTGTYTIGLTVKDIPKVPPQLQSDLFERQINVVKNDPPVSKFSLSPNPILDNRRADYKDESYDPNNHPLINYSWTIEQLDANGVILKSWNTGSPPKDFSLYGVGKYRITQTIFDNPPYPLPSLKGESSIIVNVAKGPRNPYPNFDFTPVSPVAGEKIQLNPDSSYDEDGEVIRWEWKITDPSGNISTSTSEYPSIVNAREGQYTVSLHVYDNDNLKSVNPKVQTISVDTKPPNIPPVAKFTWDPYSPFVGEEIELNPDSSFDLDGEIVSYRWYFRNGGTIKSSTERYPSLLMDKDFYDVRLYVRDDSGEEATILQRVNANIAKLDSLVTHTPEWSEKWVNKGFDKDVNTFYAGEKFVINLKSSPAAFVWGEVDFGGSVGKIDIPKTNFKLVSTSQYEYVWSVELWKEEFNTIPEGEYMFNFHSMHPVNSPYVQANDSYIIEIVDNTGLNFHRRY
ncbi:PKD domain-containing protein [Rossellomorea sp. NPDC071047]|uniref:PKD domain-containing protein n=1 Tax=Rossellomorea sp. NPDC071047 TaxID=3390675 RepID=UPI003CFE7F64